METNFTNPPENPVPCSHLNGANMPAMVDTTRKPVTLRTAVARAVLRVPARVAEAFDGTELRSPKGPVFQTAITAGVRGRGQVLRSLWRRASGPSRNGAASAVPCGGLRFGPCGAGKRRNSARGGVANEYEKGVRECKMKWP